MTEPKEAPKPMLDQDEIANTYGMPKVIAKVPDEGSDRERVFAAQDVVAAYEAKGDLPEDLEAYVKARVLVRMAEFRNELAEFVGNRARNHSSLIMDICGHAGGPCKRSPPIFDLDCLDAQQECDRSRGAEDALHDLEKALKVETSRERHRALMDMMGNL